MLFRSFGPFFILKMDLERKTRKLRGDVVIVLIVMRLCVVIAVCSQMSREREREKDRHEKDAHRCHAAHAGPARLFLSLTGKVLLINVQITIKYK